MEHIKNIEIKNFKSISHQKIEGCKRINVFVGPPNVGKSNILEAMGLSHYKRATNKVFIKDFVRFEDAAEIFFEGNARDSSIITINQNISLYLQYRNKDEVSITPESFDEKLKYITFQRENIGIGTNEFPELYKYIFDSKKLISAQGFMHFGQLAAPFGENIYQIIREYDDLRKGYNELLKNYGLRILIDKVTNSLKLIKTVDEDSIFSLSFSLLADTLQRLIFYKAAIASNKNSVLLFEEPEAHMYAPYISKFTSDMMYDENNNQFFVATHSAYVVNDIMENLKKDDYSIYTVGYDKDTGETLIRRMTDEELQEIYQFGVDLFLNLENYLPNAQQQ